MLCTVTGIKEFMNTLSASDKYNVYDLNATEQVPSNKCIMVEDVVVQWPTQSSSQKNDQLVDVSGKLCIVF